MHLLLQLAGKPVGLARQEVAEVVDDLAMLLGTDPADAGCRTFVDVAEQARTVDLLVPLEHPTRTGSRGKHPGEQIQCLPDPPGVRVRAKIPHTLTPPAPIAHHPP